MMRLRSVIVLAFLLLAVCLVWIGASGHAPSGDPARNPPPLILTDAQSTYSLGPYLEILRDPTRNLTLRDVTSPANAVQFVPNSQAIPNLGFTGDAIWIRWRIRNDSSLGSWWLVLNEARLNHIELYSPGVEGSEYHVRVSGRELPFVARELPYREFVFSLDLPRGAEQSLYLRLNSTSPLRFPLTVATPTAFAQPEMRTLLLLGLFYGAMLIMAGYNLFLFFALRDPSYLYLTLFIASYSLSTAVRDGLAQQYLWPFLPYHSALVFVTALTLIFQIKFTTGILETRLRAPPIHRVFNGLVVLILGVGTISIWFPLNSVMNLLTILTLGTEGAAAMLIWRQGYRIVRLYLVSWVMLLVAGIGLALSNLALLPGLEIPESSVIAAAALGALFWSLALADRVNLLKAETESANRQLATANQSLERSERKYRSIFESSRDAIFITTREGRVLDLNPAGVQLFGYDEAELNELNARELYAEPSDRDQITQAQDTHGFIQDYPVRMRRKDGGEIDALITSTVRQDAELKETGYQGIIRDVTEQLRIAGELEQHRHHLEELVEIRTAQAATELAERRRAQAELQWRIKELSALNEIVTTVSAVKDMDSALQTAPRRVTELLGASAVTILTLDREHAQAGLLALYPELPSWEKENPPSFDLDEVPLIRQVIDQARSLRLFDASNSPLVRGIRDLLLALGTQTLLAVPLRAHGDAIGVVLIHSQDNARDFDATGTNLAETIASVLATALENLRLYQHAQAIAVEQERQRMARELHDSVIQTLYSTVLMASGWRMMAEQGRLDMAGVAGHFQQVAEQNEQALKEMRLLVFQLRPAALQQLGLVRALQQRLDTVEQRVNIETRLETTGDWEHLLPRVEQDLYAIAQEALNNALRHSHAKAIVLRLAQHDHVFELSIEDNGTGFEPSATSGGMGLRNMRERASDIGATITVTTAPQQGSKIHIYLELAADVDA